jgi:hypothetical protein
MIHMGYHRHVADIRPLVHDGADLFITYTIDRLHAYAIYTYLIDCEVNHCEWIERDKLFNLVSLQFHLKDRGKHVVRSHVVCIAQY